MPEFKGPLNSEGIKAYNVPGIGERVSDLLKISSAVVLPANSRLVVTSGNTGFGDDMKCSTNISEQVDQAFKNVEAALASAGVKDGFRSVYQMTSYHVPGPDLTAALDLAIEKYFGGNRPAWTGVDVAGLYDGARLEITAYATLPAED